MRVRIVSAVVMVPAALFVVWLGDFVFSGFVALAALMASWEWARLCSTNKKPNHGIALGLTLAVAVVLASLGQYGAAYAVLSFGAVVVVLVGRFWSSSGGPFAGGQATCGEWTSSLWVAAGTVYFGIPCVALVWLRTDLPNGGQQVFWLLLVVWTTDIGAYAVGRAVGGPKLAPRISPGKTWAGFLGAVLLSAGFGLVSAYLDPALSVIWLAIFAAGLSVLAQLGDLGESAAKRRFGVKDSSGLIPGHGGVLDRIDGLLAASAGYAAVCLVNSGSALTWQS